ncbi:hypothetical protein ERJ75_000503000 [Trypanosoma vivax]|nr:hypothetical protein ERJ75_000503000 [Trypanosoma vivax]
MKSSFSFIAVRLVIVLWLAAVCRVSFCKDDSEPWKTQQKEHEKVFLCGTADLFVEWNVTFGALQKRAEKVNNTATKILRNLELYKNSTGVKHNTSAAIKSLNNVMNNTSAALNTSRGFMDGIERDFFNAFEAVKDYPENFTFGYSNWNLHGKRESEILKFFKNITMLFTECKTNRTGRNVTIDLLEQEVMNEVDNETTNLTEWEEKRKTKWNASLTNVTTWLSQIQNYTYNHSTDVPKRTVNIWTYDVTVWDTIKKDCHRVAYNFSNNSTVPTIVNSSRLNILRHLQDIANQSTANNSLKENGCEGGHELFQSTVSAGFSEVEKNGSKLEEMCKNLSSTLQNHTCTTKRTSVEWMRHRFNVTVPEMIERLGRSLTHLIEAEKLVMGTFADLFTSRREALCNETRIVNEMNATFDMMATSNASCEVAIDSANALLVSAEHNVTEARNRSVAALELASKAQNVINVISPKFHETKSASDVEANARATEDSKMAVFQVIRKTENERKELKKVSGELAAARDEKKNRLEAILTNFSNAFKHPENEFTHDANVCDASSFVAPNVSIYVADSVFAQLVAVNFSADSTNGDKLLESCTQKVKAMREFVKEIGVHSNATRDNASQAWKQAIVAEEKAKEAERMARDVLKNELERQQTKLCDTVKQLTENKWQHDSASERSKYSEGKCCCTIEACNSRNPTR